MTRHRARCNCRPCRDARGWPRREQAPRSERDLWLTSGGGGRAKGARRDNRVLILAILIAVVLAAAAAYLGG